MAAKNRKLSRTHDYRITETFGSPQFVNKKVRVKLLQEHEDIPVGIDGFLYDLEAYMLTGPMRGEVVNLPPCKLITVETRKCMCKAYKFPHAPGFGECKEARWADGAKAGLKLEDLFK